MSFSMNQDRNSKLMLACVPVWSKICTLIKIMTHKEQKLGRGKCKGASECKGQVQWQVQVKFLQGARINVQKQQKQRPKVDMAEKTTPFRFSRSGKTSCGGAGFTPRVGHRARFSYQKLLSFHQSYRSKTPIMCHFGAFIGSQITKPMPKFIRRF